MTFMWKTSAKYIFIYKKTIYVHLNLFLFALIIELLVKTLLVNLLRSLSQTSYVE